MKINFAYPVRSFSGTRDDMTYAALNDGYLCIGRDYTVPIETTQNVTMGNVATNLATVYGSFDAGWIADLKTYNRRYNTDVLGKDKIHPTYYALYNKMWYAVHKDDPTIDLKTVTFADIALIGISIQTVKEAIDYGYLPKVSKYDDLTNTYNGA